MSLGPQFQSAVRGVATGLTVSGLAAATAVAGMTHEAPTGGWGGSHAKVAATYAKDATNVPQWDKHLSQQFKGFSDIETRPKGTIPSRVAVVPKNGEPYSMGFDRAYKINNDREPANNVWTVGYK